MSGALMVRFEKGEIQRVKQLIGTFAINDIIWSPDPRDRSKNREDSGLYVKYQNNVMELEYKIWDQYASGWAIILVRELIRYFKIERIGWDSLGWKEAYTPQRFKKECHGMYFASHPIKGKINKNPGMTVPEAVRLEKELSLVARRLISKGVKGK
jgi:hypothetical protein